MVNAFAIQCLTFDTNEINKKKMESKMKTVQKTKLFLELKEKAAEGVTGKDLWRVLFYGKRPIKDGNIPPLWGRLVRVVVKKKGIYFYDTGSKWGNGSFVLRPVDTKDKLKREKIRQKQIQILLEIGSCVGPTEEDEWLVRELGKILSFCADSVLDSSPETLYKFFDFKMSITIGGGLHTQLVQDLKDQETQHDLQWRDVTDSHLEYIFNLAKKGEANEG